MAGRVKISKDGSSIAFTASDSLPTSTKKFRQSPEIEGFYRFIHENGLQREAFEILCQIIARRKAEKAAQNPKPVVAKAPKVAAAYKQADKETVSITAKPVAKANAQAKPAAKASAKTVAPEKPSAKKVEKKAAKPVSKKVAKPAAKKATKPAAKAAKAAKKAKKK